MQNIFTLESHVFASLANPKRLEILHLLSHGTLTVSQIVEMTDIAQANVSQHLAVLRRLGLVTSQKQAQTRVYHLVSPHISKACDLVRLALLEHYGVKRIESLNALRLFTDPVCGMQLSTQNAAASVVYEGKRFYFCGEGCANKFNEAHEKHANPNPTH